MGKHNYQCHFITFILRSKSLYIRLGFFVRTI